MDTTTTKDKLARFGRSLALLINRGLMYHKSHPMVQESIKEVLKTANLLFPNISPLVFIINRNQFFVDEEPLDPRINVKRIAILFKNHKIQSISFEDGLTTGELDILIDQLSSLTMAMDVENLKKAFLSKGVFNIKVNHVLYKKVTEDDQIISRDVLKKVTPALEAEDSQGRKKFMDALLETVLTEEFANTLNIKSLLANPRQFSTNMIKADLISSRRIAASQSIPDDGAIGETTLLGTRSSSPETSQSGDLRTESDNAIGGNPLEMDDEEQTIRIEQDTNSNNLADKNETTIRSGYDFNDMELEPTPTSDSITAADDHPSNNPNEIPISIGGGHGPMLLHQLEVIQNEVEKQLEAEGEVSIADLADAVFEMKRQFFEELQTQKTLGIAYANEDAIVRNMNKLSDQVILKLIQEEYNAGKITTQRLAQIIKQLIPESQELKRLLPQIKTTLARSGMPPDAYLELIATLKNELENEDLIRILEESSEAIGIDRDDLIDELKRNPNQAAKLIYLASEINKGASDEAVLTDILVDYVEKISGQQAAQAQKEGQIGDDHLKQVIHTVESTLLQQLSKLDVGDDVLSRMENRINERMDNILDKMRIEWLNFQGSTICKEKEKPRSVLQTLEHSVFDDEALVEILKIVRSKVEAGEIEENNFSQIDAEIARQRERIKKEAKNRDIPDGA